MKLFKCAAAFVAAVMTAFGASAQDPTVKWTVTANPLGDNNYEIVFDGEIAEGYHTYDVKDDFSPTEITFNESDAYTLVGELYSKSELSTFEDEFGDTLNVYFDHVTLVQNVALNGAGANISGEVFLTSCDENSCRPEVFEFEITAGEPQAAAQSDSPKSRLIDWGIVLEAILWGFAALLTPCVFPMVPMTVSFFLKGSGSKAGGRMKALMYGIFIVLLYTLPIAVIILITRFAGGETVTADIFNWLATHWIPNIIFFVVFMVFAASFFGAFEITLPSALVNKSDRNSDKGGIIGIFFMALTLVLVSFSCTGPIVGSVLIKSTSGEFLQPIVTMLAFSLAFALPFTVFALFPSLLKNLPKSGGWLNSVKVVLGFIEVALGFKFLSVADQTYHWGLLDREVYLAIWIVCFSLMGLYLLGKLRFAHDSKLEYISVTRLTLAIGVFAFVVYMIPGMWGAPLKALSGYLPPIQTQDFVVGKSADTSGEVVKAKYGDFLHLPHGLSGYFDLEEAKDAAAKSGKPIFVDVTGHGCVNCREMEARVWSDPAVLEILRNDYVIVALYCDDKTKLPESEWLTDDDGKVYKSLGQKNSYITRTLFNVNAQPNYVLLSPDGRQLVPARAYDLDVNGFVQFLESGIDEYSKLK